MKQLLTVLCTTAEGAGLNCARVRGCAPALKQKLRTDSSAILTPSNRFRLVQEEIKYPPLPAEDVTPPISVAYHLCIITVQTGYKLVSGFKNANRHSM